MQFIHRYVFAVGFANTKRYDMIALLPQTVPKAHYNLAKPIITLNSPQAIITAHLLCGRYAKRGFFLYKSAFLCYNKRDFNKRYYAVKTLSKDFTRGNIMRQLILFSLPFMASNAMQVLYSTIDMIIVGRLHPGHWQRNVATLLGVQGS